MTRYGCFEIQATCSHCGQPLPVNGVLQNVTCTACSQVTKLPPDHLPDFMNDFEKEYPGLEEKQGQGGQMMGGGQSYKYGYYRLSPRCGKCKAPLAEVAPGTDGYTFCNECGHRYHAYPPPDWLRAKVPSAVQIISPERELAGAEGDQSLQINQEKVQPVMMSCPGCGGGLTITTETQRTCSCQFCEAQIFIPDELWKKLHPVKTKLEWFVRFEGATHQQLSAERRRRDQEAEQAEIGARGRFAPKAGGAKGAAIPWRVIISIGLGIMIAGAGVVASVAAELLGYAVPEAVVVVPFIVGLMVAIFGSIAPAMLGTRAGPLKSSKEAMIAVARKHGMEIHGEHETSYIGSARGSIQGRDVELSPSSDEAIEVELDERVFYLKTDPRWARPDEDLWRFTTGDPRFDQLFPIRYAKPEIVQRLEQSQADLAPLFWFIDRWGPRIARMEVDSDVELHIVPGGGENEIMKYLAPEDVEPLLNDTLVLARALDAVARGKQPELPAHTGASQHPAAYAPPPQYAQQAQYPQQPPQQAQYQQPPQQSPPPQYAQQPQYPQQPPPQYAQQAQYPQQPPAQYAQQAQYPQQPPQQYPQQAQYPAQQPQQHPQQQGQSAPQQAPAQPVAPQQYPGYRQR